MRGSQSRQGHGQSRCCRCASAVLATAGSRTRSTMIRSWRSLTRPPADAGQPTSSRPPLPLRWLAPRRSARLRILGRRSDVRDGWAVSSTERPSPALSSRFVEGSCAGRGIAIWRRPMHSLSMRGVNVPVVRLGTAFRQAWSGSVVLPGCPQAVDPSGRHFPQPFVDVQQGPPREVPLARGPGGRVSKPHPGERRACGSPMDHEGRGRSGVGPPTL